MKYENHIHTAAFSEAALDTFLQGVRMAAAVANSSRKYEEAKYLQQANYNKVHGTSAAAHALCIGCIIEMDDGLDYFTSIRVYCGDYDKTVEV